MFDIYDLIGVAGAAFSIYCYGRVQWRRDFAKTFEYSALNVVSAALVGVSFLHHWNLSSFIINSFWGVISMYGVYRCVKYHRKSKKAK